MTIEEAILSSDIEAVMDKMVLYAMALLKDVDTKSLQGKEPMDFVQDVFTKALDRVRNWDESKCDFINFLFGCLKSEISNFVTTSKQILSHSSAENISVDTDNINDVKDEIIKLLKHEGADEHELLLFGLWIEGLTKPSEIAEYSEIDIKEVLNISKRLKRRLLKVQTPIKGLI